ncbi:hypothetical protein AB6A40_007438 [Gnathostoma spinigerum]|uniref:Uncharacterized protein n=1 Tax=Gnathostoma spinigerum TaxID=75299 RepID=A0ABD6EL82_9BILA
MKNSPNITKTIDEYKLVFVDGYIIVEKCLSHDLLAVIYTESKYDMIARSDGMDATTKEIAEAIFEP